MLKITGCRLIPACLQFTKNKCYLDLPSVGGLIEEHCEEEILRRINMADSNKQDDSDTDGYDGKLFRRGVLIK